MKTVFIESITETEADGYYFGKFKAMDPIMMMGPLDAPVCLITVEPGLYIPEIGGCRIEDTVLVTEDGYEFINIPTYEWIID